MSRIATRVSGVQPGEPGYPELESQCPNWVVKYTESDTGGALPPRFPYIVDDATGEICQVALLFMADEHLTIKSSFNSNTVQAYTHDLLDWMRYGAEFRIPWNKATHADLGRYVDSLGLVSPHLAQAAKQATVDRRLVPIRQLYEWAANNLPHFLVDAPVGTLLKAQNVAGFLDDRRKDLRNRPDYGGESTEDVSMPNVMEPVQLAAVLKEMGPAPTATFPFGQGSNPETSVGHLGMYIACQAGLRVGEVVSLRVKWFSKYLNQEIVSNRMYDIGPFRRKGGKFKRVKFHGVLLRKVVDYIQGERAWALQGFVLLEGRLLIHLKGRFRGKPITKSTLQRRFTNACSSVGLTHTVTKYKPSAEGALEKVNETRSSFTFHDLRHTYAVWMYYARKADGDSEPWKYIQEQLGHEDVTTTIKIYLKVTQDFEAAISDNFVGTLNVIARVGEHCTTDERKDS